MGWGNRSAVVVAFRSSKQVAAAPVASRLVAERIEGWGFLVHTRMSTDLLCLWALLSVELLRSEQCTPSAGRGPSPHPFPPAICPFFFWCAKSNRKQGARLVLLKTIHVSLICRHNFARDCPSPPPPSNSFLLPPPRSASKADAWSMANLLKQATNDYAPLVPPVLFPPRPPPPSPPPASTIYIALFLRNWVCTAYRGRFRSFLSVLPVLYFFIACLEVLPET